MIFVAKGLDVIPIHAINVKTGVTKRDGLKDWCVDAAEATSPLLWKLICLW